MDSHLQNLGHSKSIDYFLSHYNELSDDIKKLVDSWKRAKDFGTKDMIECKLESVYGEQCKKLLS